MGGQVPEEATQGAGIKGRGPSRGRRARRGRALSTPRVAAPGLRDQHGDGPGTRAVSINLLYF